jgi:hypothetical protein
MQPPAESGFDRAEHINQRGLGVAMDPGLGGSVFPNVNGGQSYSLPRQKPEIYLTISYRSVSLGYGIAGGQNQGCAPQDGRGGRRGIRCQLWHVSIDCASSWIGCTHQGCCTRPMSIG